MILGTRIAFRIHGISLQSSTQRGKYKILAHSTDCLQTSFFLIVGLISYLPWRECRHPRSRWSRRRPPPRHRPLDSFSSSADLDPSACESPRCTRFDDVSAPQIDSVTFILFLNEIHFGDYSGLLSHSLSNFFYRKVNKIAYLQNYSFRQTDAYKLAKIRIYRFSNVLATEK